MGSCFVVVNISFPSLPPILQLLLVGRWFCEGSELHSSPDIQILWDGGDLHTLVIAEAFEDDTGRYTCLAANSSGSDSTSAEVFIEGTQGCRVWVLLLSRFSRVRLCVTP